MVTDADRMAYAEKVLGITIDKQQDWVLTNEYSVSITADADLDDISAVAVLDANPYAGENNRLIVGSLTNGGTTTLKFRAPKNVDMLYAACLTSDGQCVARPFVPGVDETVSFIYNVPRRNASRRVAPTPYEADYDSFYMKDFLTFLRLVRNTLPEGQDNRAVVGKHNYTNTVTVRLNPYDIHDLPVAYIGGNSGDEVDLSYEWFPQGQELGMGSFLINDNYPQGWDAYQYDRVTREYELSGHRLYCRDADGEDSQVFTPTDKVRFYVAKNDRVLPDTDGERVKVFMLNQYVVVACEDGDDWDYNDRVFWMPYGVERLEEISEPAPPTPQVWTYAWEDKDYGDYDMNDCVIEVEEHADDPSKITVTLVALGGARNLWLGFENKNAKSYKDYTPVIQKELHEVLGVAVKTLVNTGRSKANPVVIYDGAKPAGFDFQTCSFVLGAKAADDQQSVYHTDYYYMSIPTKGQDPHGIVIPGKWQWPTETTCIKDAYPEFNTWAQDRTKALDWYKKPAAGKVVGE